MVVKIYATVILSCVFLMKLYHFTRLLAIHSIWKKAFDYFLLHIYLCKRNFTGQSQTAKEDFVQVYWNRGAIELNSSETL